MTRLPMSWLAFTAMVCAGCSASLPTSPDAQPGSSEGPLWSEVQVTNADISPQYRKTGSLLYHVLAGEIAGYRGEMEVALEHYLTAIELTEDPGVAERAMRIAVFGDAYPPALKAARRWVELAPDSLDARRSLALLYLRSGQTEQAVETFEQALTLAGGDNPRAFHMVTALLSREEDSARALEVMGKLVARHPENAQGLYAYAQMAVQQDEFELARGAVEKALLQRPEWPDARLLQARILLAQGQTEAALSSMEEVVNAHPESRPLRIGYARLLAEAGRFERARQQFEALLEHSPGDPELLYTVSLLAIEGERYEMAEDYLTRLMDTGERVGEAHFLLGAVAEDRGNLEQAIAEYRQVRQGERVVDAHIRVAVLLARTGQLRQAREYLNKMETDDPEVAQRLELAEVDVLREAGRYQEALEVLNGALAAQPGNADLLYARAMVAEKLDRLALLERDLKQILASDPENAHALNALGYTLADRTQRHEEALDYIRRALELAPDSAAILDSMGWIQYRMGNHSKALNYLRRAYEADQDPEIAAHLGEVLWVTGEQDRAREIWERARSQDPDNPVLQKTLERFL